MFGEKAIPVCLPAPFVQAFRKFFFCRYGCQKPVAKVLPILPMSASVPGKLLAGTVLHPVPPFHLIQPVKKARILAPIMPCQLTIAKSLVNVSPMTAKTRCFLVLRQKRNRSMKSS
ncbi:hypothetical protein CDL15_Pgr012519 [Punica granatum]|uniref:Uncharacterized protein n=1 Tax=Punica granatum TaxID=22663 RepID=A0A218Y020_PUNGR|nr:hypothetical protein CDL15_Pgr012519 [Punica granatum]